MRQYMYVYVGLHNVCETQANVSIPEYKYAYVNAEIHMLTHCLYNGKLMLIFPNIYKKKQGKIHVYILYAKRKLM